MKKILATFFIGVVIASFTLPLTSKAALDLSSNSTSYPSYVALFKDQQNYDSYISTYGRPPANQGDFQSYEADKAAGKGKYIPQWATNPFLQGVAAGVRSQVPGAEATAQTASDALNSENTACSLKNGSLLTCAQYLFARVVQFIGNLILSIVSWILWFAGIMFNLSIITMVVNMKAFLDKISAVYVVWQTLRDFANMFFIFILLMIAIQTILGSGNYKKMLRDIILVALFLNFSFFATGVLIDFSNTTALLFYKGFSNTNCTAGATAGVLEAADGCMSYTIVNSLKLQTIYTQPTNTTLSTSTSVAAATGADNLAAIATDNFANLFKFVLTVIMGSILMIVVAGVFIASAILIFYRFITLIMLLMLSPLAFASIVLPSTKGKVWNRWWGLLTKQLIFAPVYFMFLWIVMKIISSGALIGTLNTTGSGGFLSAFSGNMSAMFGLIANYIIIIFLLGFSMKLAVELGAAGVDVASKASKGFQGFVGRNTVGLAAKHTIGRAASGLDKTWAKNTGVMGGTGWIGSKLRNVTTGAVVKSKLGGAESFAEYDKSNKERLKANAEQVRKNINKTTLSDGFTTLKTTLPANATPAQISERQNKIQNLANYAKTASATDLTKLKADEVATLAENGMITPEKMVNILDSDKNKEHNPVEIEEIRKSYSKKVNDALTKYLTPPRILPANATQAEKDAQKAELEAKEKALKSAITELGEDGVKVIDPSLTSGIGTRSEKFIQMASGKQYQKIIETSYDKKPIREARLKEIVNLATANPTGTSEELMKAFRNLDGADLSHLASTAYRATFTRILNDPDFINALETKVLIKANEELDSAAKLAIKDAVESPIATATNSKKQDQIKKWMTSVAF